MTTSQEAEKLLDVNNIEVIYNHVILVLKGVSLSVPKGGITQRIKVGSKYLIFLKIENPVPVNPEIDSKNEFKKVT